MNDNKMYFFSIFYMIKIEKTTKRKRSIIINPFFISIFKFKIFYKIFKKNIYNILFKIMAQVEDKIDEVTKIKKVYDTKNKQSFFLFK